MMMFAADNPPTQTSQALTFTLVASAFAFLTLAYTTHAKRKDTALANERLDRVEAAAAAAATDSNTKLNRIERSQDIMHAMLNSAQTSQMIAYIVTMKSSRASLRIQQTQAKDLAALRGTDNDPQVLADLASLQEQITALGVEIQSTQDAVDDRVRAQELAESRERNRTKDNMPNEVSSMVPKGSPDPTQAPAVADTAVVQPDPTNTTINIETASIDAGVVTVQAKEPNQ
jgi:hypothetical protein